MGTFIIYTHGQSITVGQQAQLTYVNAVGPVRWESLDVDVATIDDHGLVTGRGQSTLQGVTILATDSTERRASTTLWVGALSVSPQDVGGDTGVTVPFTVSGATGTVRWSSLNPATATIDPSGLATTQSLGVAILAATDENGNTGYATLHAGTLLVYGADGTLYLVPGQLWSVAAIVPPERSGVPSFTDMNNNAQSSTKELAAYVPPSALWTTCYVLNPAPIKPS